MNAHAGHTPVYSPWHTPVYSPYLRTQLRDGRLVGAPPQLHPVVPTVGRVATGDTFSAFDVNFSRLMLGSVDFEPVSGAPKTFVRFLGAKPLFPKPRVVAMISAVVARLAAAFGRSVEPLYVQVTYDDCAPLSPRARARKNGSDEPMSCTGRTHALSHPHGIDIVVGTNQISFDKLKWIFAHELTHQYVPILYRGNEKGAETAPMQWNEGCVEYLSLVLTFPPSKIAALEAEQARKYEDSDADRQNVQRPYVEGVRIGQRLSNTQRDALVAYVARHGVWSEARPRDAPVTWFTRPVRSRHVRSPT